jgi:amino acid adenylation domain-containing protein
VFIGDFGKKGYRIMLTNVMQYLDATAAKYPNKVAFSDGSCDCAVSASEKTSEARLCRSCLTFKQLRDAARRIASKLLADGITGQPVAVFMEKSPKAIAANFAAVYSGNFYVSLDREMPVFRVEKILESLKPPVVIRDEDFDGFADFEINEDALAKVRETAIDIDPIYVVFTSGSSGTPKGVTACHRSVIDYIENLSEVLGVTDTTVFGNQAPLYVDACLKEVYTSIKCGSSAVLIPKSEFMFPVKLIEFLNAHRINTICWVSSALSMIAGFKTFASIVPEHLHTVAFGSELFPVKNLNIWREALPNARFFNLYGPTEATGMSSYYEIPATRRFAEDERIPIGRAFPNTQILLLDAEGKEQSSVCPELKEICIRGSCLSLGYYSDSEKTAEAFVQNPATSAYPDLVYKTGDLGEYNDRGELVYVARKDYQIKHMGYRIELPEIEAAFCRNDAVSLACCQYDSEKSKILLYYTGGITPAEATKYLKEKLPRYMLPNKTFHLEQMPLTPNGKIDRAKLKEMNTQEATHGKVT